jgi:hypothetical protein
VRGWIQALQGGTVVVAAYLRWWKFGGKALAYMPRRISSFGERKERVIGVLMGWSWKGLGNAYL